jgi:spermidine/putrescine transport system substrate-binding protein
MTTSSVHPMIAALRSGLLSRRDFVRQALASGAGLPAVAAVLSACGTGADRPAAEGAMPQMAAAPEQELTIYNWSDYIGETTLADFERETGIRVTYDTYESNEDLIAKLQAGATGYDLVMPSNYAVRVLRALDLIDPMDRGYFSNWGNLDPVFLGQAFDPENRYSVPWQWGLAGVAVRTDRLPAPDSWAVFHDAAFRGKMTQLDDMRDVIGCWLTFRGRSLNSVDPGELAQAKADALLAKANLKSYLSAPVKAQLIAGDVWVAQLWNGDTAQARSAQGAIEFVLPKEGSMVYLDSMVMPRGARHRRAAHEFVNYVLRAEVAAGISRASGYGSPNAAALALDPALLRPPSGDELRRLEYQEDLGPATGEWDRIWTETKAG